MDFAKRPASNIKKLETVISFSETNGSVELEIKVTGLIGVAVTIELCFEKEGKLSGTTTLQGGNSFLETGMGKYESGGDVIHFGPGTLTHKNINGLEGEKYSTHFGSLRTEGQYVYLTVNTPFIHTLKFS